MTRYKSYLDYRLESRGMCALCENDPYNPGYVRTLSLTKQGDVIFLCLDHWREEMDARRQWNFRLACTLSLPVIAWDEAQCHRCLKPIPVYEKTPWKSFGTIEDRDYCRTCYPRVFQEKLIRDGKGEMSFDYEVGEATGNHIGTLSDWLGIWQIKRDSVQWSYHNRGGWRHDMWFSVPGDPYQWWAMAVGYTGQAICKRTKDKYPGLYRYCRKCGHHWDDDVLPGPSYCSNCSEKIAIPSRDGFTITYPTERRDELWNTTKIELPKIDRILYGLALNGTLPRSITG